jgi:hypothetical protein
MWNLNFYFFSPGDSEKSEIYFYEFVKIRNSQNKIDFSAVFVTVLCNLRHFQTNLTLHNLVIVESNLAPLDGSR